MAPEHYALAADAVLALHVALVLFVVLLPALLPFGVRRGWRMARSRRFRLFHLLVLGFVVLQAWGGWLCPLTSWEMQLRERSGGATYQGDFIAHWLGRLLYVQAPAWAFTLVYTLFLGAVIAVNLRWPPGAGASRHGK